MKKYDKKCHQKSWLTRTIYELNDRLFEDKHKKKGKTIKRHEES